MKTPPEATKHTVDLVKALDSHLTEDEKKLLQDHVKALSMKQLPHNPGSGDLAHLQSARAALTEQDFETFRQSLDKLPEELKKKISTWLQTVKSSRAD